MSSLLNPPPPHDGADLQTVLGGSAHFHLQRVRHPSLHQRRYRLSCTPAREQAHTPAPRIALTALPSSSGVGRVILARRSKGSTGGHTCSTRCTCVAESRPAARRDAQPDPTVRACACGLAQWRAPRINVHEGHCQDRQMTTGLHTVRDIYCSSCGRVLGWKYVPSAAAARTGLGVMAR